MSRVETESRRGYVAEELWFGGELLPAAMAACYSVHLPLCGHPSSSIVVTENESCSLWLWRHAGVVTATTALIQQSTTSVLFFLILYVMNILLAIGIHSQIRCFLVCLPVCLSV